MLLSVFIAIAIACLKKSFRRSRCLSDIYIIDKCTEFITFTSVDVFHSWLHFIPDLSNP